MTLGQGQTVATEGWRVTSSMAADRSPVQEKLIVLVRASNITSITLQSWNGSVSTTKSKMTTFKEFMYEDEGVT